MKIKMIKSKDQKVRIIQYGTREKTVIVGLHGLGASAYTFHEISKYLDDYCLISIDLPGHGKSEDLETDFEPDYLVNWLNEVLVTLKIDKCHMLGHSWGGTVALRYSGDYPSKVDKVILVDGGYHDPKFGYNYFIKKYETEGSRDFPFTSFEDEAAYYYEDFDNYKFDSFQEAVDVELKNHENINEYKRVMVEDLIIEEEGIYKWHARGSTAHKALIMQVESQSRINFANMASEVFLAYAQYDEYSLTCRQLQIFNLDSKISMTSKLYKGAGHMVHYDQPEILADDIKTFIKKEEPNVG